MPDVGKILVVEDDRDSLDLLIDLLERRGHTARGAASAKEALALLEGEDVDAVLTDVLLEHGTTGIELCGRLLELRADIPVVVVTSHGSMETAVAAIRAGAFDFITKPIDVDKLHLAVTRAVRHRHLTGELRRLHATVAASRPDPRLVGDSPAMREVFDLILKVGATDASILVTGESGTGKELVAQAIHAASARKEQPFVAVNCAAIPANLLESELFGHVRGAFTDAHKDRPGLFQRATGGTLFLDEIGEMPIEMQVKLLRVLQERSVRPVGGDAEVPFDVRLITATNRDLETEVEEERFRSDLFYRINVVHVVVPPLRERKSDVLLLAHHFLRRHAERAQEPVLALSRAAAQKLLDYDWPGNVRELENCVDRATALTRFSEIGVDALPDKIVQHQAAQLVISSENPDEMPTLAEMERRYVRRVLEAVGGNKTHAARVLGLDRRSLYRRLDKLAKAGEPESDDG
jgi:two-component system response regulator HydG